ncbi:MAG: DUF11 domain-containing protein, partial [Acidobacteria bacterium]|nr:DUF11 domain-containing protein [Acidobacteriota bacterium]
VSNPTGSTETAGGRVLFNFGTITNTDVNNAAPETLTLTYRAVVLNTATNVRGTGRNNSVTWTAVTPPVNASAPNVIIIEPGLQAVKTVTPTRADAGDTVTYTIVVSHAAASNAPAFESALSDTLPAGLTVTAGPTATGTAPDTLTLSSGVINATWTTLPLGGSTTITFTARLDEALTPATVVTNVSNLSWTGLPGNAATSPSPHNALGVERTGNTAHPGAAANTYRASDPADVTINSNSLAGSVYVDVDGNGALTTGEPPIAGVSITLTGTDHLGNAVSQTTVTGADGGYAFLLLRPGTYTVREMQPAGYADGVDRAGTQLGTVGNDVISGVVLPTGGVTDAGGYDFGERPTADLEVLRTGAPGPALPGGTLPHTIVVRNHGPSNATQVVVRHPMPAGTAVTAIVAPGFSCTTPAPNTIGDVICTAAVLAAGASTTIDITTQVSPALLSGAVITYAAAVSGEQVDLRPADNHYAAPITVAGPGTADLSMTLTDDVDPVVAGGNVTYTLTIRNHGPATASGVIATDTLPAGVTLVSATPSQGTACAGTTTVSCDLGTLTNGSTATVTVVVTPPAAGVLVNQADVTATETDPSLTNNQAAQSTTVGNAIDADLVVTQSDATDVVTPDDVIAYRVRVENRGPAPATSVVITDVLPAGTVFEGAIVPAGWTCTTPAIGAAGVVTCSVPSLPAGAAATLDLRVRVLPSTPPGTSAVNTATVTSATPDPNAADNSSSETTLIAAAGAAEVAILITDAPDAQAAGAPLSYALTVTNNGPATATAVTITDPLPAGTSLIAGSTPCVASSGVVTCNVGTLLPGGTTVVGVTLATPPAATGLTNQASIAATQGDPVLTNNTDAESTTLVSVADVRIAVAGPPAATPGTVASYSFTVTNDG